MPVPTTMATTEIVTTTTEPTEPPETTPPPPPTTEEVAMTTEATALETTQPSSPTTETVATTTEAIEPETTQPPTPEGVAKTTEEIGPPPTERVAMTTETPPPLSHTTTNALGTDAAVPNSTPDTSVVPDNTVTDVTTRSTLSTLAASNDRPGDIAAIVLSVIVVVIGVSLALLLAVYILRRRKKKYLHGHTIGMLQFPHYTNDCITKLHAVAININYSDNQLTMIHMTIRLAKLLAYL